MLLAKNLLSIRRCTVSVLVKEYDEHGILTLKLNRPEKLNALNQEVLENLSETLAEAKDDAKVKAVLITGEGKAFCAGADINRLAECTAETGYQFANQGQSVFRQVETLGKPVLAAVNGFSFGGGCELAMSAHLRIASEKAQFGQPEVKLGVIPGYGGTQRLARLVGKGRALDLCMTGRFIKADVALAWGLVTEVVEQEQLISRAKEILVGIIGMAPLAIRATMDVIDKGFDMNLDDALHLEAVHFAMTCASQDKQEGVSAFLEKRVADFKGE
jgi:enoyl-CoA hydratase